MLCSEARAIAKKLKSLSGTVSFKCNNGEIYSVDSDVSILGGFITAKDSKGKMTEIDLCGKKNFTILNSKKTGSIKKREKGYA